jgi:hypothetical protein
MVSFENAVTHAGTLNVTEIVFLIGFSYVVLPAAPGGSAGARSNHPGWVAIGARGDRDRTRGMKNGLDARRATSDGRPCLDKSHQFYQANRREGLQAAP